MKVNGHVTLSVSLNVIGLETEAVSVNENGELMITDPDQFFMDWVEEWDQGNGELLGASEDSVELDVVSWY